MCRVDSEMIDYAQRHIAPDYHDIVKNEIHQDPSESIRIRSLHVASAQGTASSSRKMDSTNGVALRAILGATGGFVDGICRMRRILCTQKGGGRGAERGKKQIT